MTLNYIGSKKSLLNFIEAVLNCNKISKKKQTFGDLFAGTGIVGQYFFDKYKYKIVSNDLEKYSYIINTAFLKCNYTKPLGIYIKKLNLLEGIEGLVYKTYSPGCPQENRMFWTKENAKKIDAIREEIEIYKTNGKIDDDQYNFLLASLITSADKVANIASVYGAFLKKFKPSALKEFELKPVHILNCRKKLAQNKILNDDIKNVTERCDIIYLDPPYNNRQYGANYFPLNFIAQYDENIEIRGKTGLFDYNKSKYCVKKEVKQEFKNLLEILMPNTKYLLLSYNNEGLMNHAEISEILLKYGNVKLYKHKYKKFKSNKSNPDDSVIEYIFFLEKFVPTFEEIDFENI